MFGPICVEQQIRGFLIQMNLSYLTNSFSFTFEQLLTQDSGWFDSI